MLAVKSYDACYIKAVHDRIAAALAVVPDDPRMLNELIVALDASFVHRMRGQEGKDGNPLNEVRMLANAIITNKSVFNADSTIKYNSDKSITGQIIGKDIALNRRTVERLLAAVIKEIRTRFAA